MEIIRGYEHHPKRIYAVEKTECDFLGQLRKDLHSVKYASDHAPENVSLQRNV